MTPPLGTSTAPVLGLAEAAKACNVSESTIRRKRPELLSAGAKQTAKGWAIPVPVLVQLGLMDRTTSPDPESPRHSPPAPPKEAFTAPVTPSPSDTLLEALREKLADAEKRAAVAEAIAEERERIIAVQAQALRMLEAPKPAAPEAAAPSPQEQPEAQPAPAAAPLQEQPRKRWWHR